jgi:hypothetical protein
MKHDEATFLSMARPGQIDPGWVAFWATSDTSLPAVCAVWTDATTPTTEKWYLAATLAGIAQTKPLTVQKVSATLGGYTPPGTLVGRAHTVTATANPGFQSGLSKYLVIKNAGGAVVAVIGQNQSANPWIEHWWLDQNWVNLAPSTGTTVTLSAEAEGTAAAKYATLKAITYKRHSFAP